MGDQMNKVIGLVGAKGAGKTTAYRIISELLPNTVEITLAAHLKNTCSNIFAIPRDHFDSHKYKELDLGSPIYLTAKLIIAVLDAYGINPDFDKHVRSHIGKVLHTPREVAQYIGTEVLRTEDPDVHCKAAVSTVTDSNETVGVVTDIRFPNEYSFFYKNYKDFYPIYIKNTAAETNASKDAHLSESYLKELASKASKVDNENSLLDLKTNLIKVLTEIGVLK